MFDFFGGQGDLKDRSVRVLHNLSFIEDPTRLFRAVRFEQRLGFTIGRQTERLMASAVRLRSVKKIAGVRILHELEQILDEPRVVSALERLDHFELLKFIDPQLRLIDTLPVYLLLLNGQVVVLICSIPMKVTAVGWSTFLYA